MRRPPHLRRSARRHRLGLVVAGVGAALVTALPGLLAPAATSAQAATPADAALRAECPGLVEAYPGSPRHPATAGFYGLPTGIHLTDGTLDIGSNAQTTGVSATVCGYFILPGLSTRATPTPVDTKGAPDECPGCSITFAPGSVTIAGLVRLPTTLAPAGPTVGIIGPRPGPGGGLELTVTAPAIATITVPEVGVVCTVGTHADPIEVSVTTAVSGPLVGQALSGPLTGATARVVGDQFPVPAIAPSADCIAGIVPATNTLAELPAQPGQAQFRGALDVINSLTLGP